MAVKVSFYLSHKLVIVRSRILNVIVRQMSAKQRCVHRSKTCQTLKHFDNVISTCGESVVKVYLFLNWSILVVLGHLLWSRGGNSNCMFNIIRIFVGARIVLTIIKTI